MKRQRLPGWLWLMVAAAVLTQTATNLLRPVTSYKLISVGVGETEIGLATAAYAVLPLFFAMPMGRLTTRIRSLAWFTGVGAGLLGVGGIMLAATSQVWVLLVASAVLGMGHLMFTIGGQSAIARRAPAQKMDGAFGWFTAAFAVGQMAGPLLSGVLLGSTSLAEATQAGSDLDAHIATALWLGAGISLLAIPVLMGLRTTTPSTATGSIQRAEAATAPAGVSGLTGKPTMWRILKVPGIPSNMLAALALLAMLDILIAFLPLVGEAAGVSPLWVGSLLAVRGAASVVSRIFLPVFSRFLSRNALVLASLAGSAVTVAAVPILMEYDLWAAATVMGVGGLLLGLGQPLTMTLISQSVPHSWRGAALALRLVGNRLGQVALPIGAGLIAAPAGPAGGIWFACAVLGLSAAERVLTGKARGDSTSG